MSGPLTRYLVEDHQRLEVLLARAVAGDGPIDREAYAEFRAGLLRHIGMEEKVLLPAARRARDGAAWPEAERLRVEHGAIASLLVPTPTREIVGELRFILASHNVVEEGHDGVYATCDLLLEDEAEAVLARLRTFPEVKVAPHHDGPGVLRTARDALASSARSHARPRKGEAG